MCAFVLVATTLLPHSDSLCVFAVALRRCPWHADDRTAPCPRARLCLQVKIAAHGGIELIIKAMALHKRHSAVQEQERCVCCLSLHNRVPHPLALAGGAVHGTFPPMYCQRNTNPGCDRKQACAALVNLSALSANQIRIRGTRGIESIKTCMATPGVSDHAKKMGQMLLDKLLLSST